MSSPSENTLRLLTFAACVALLHGCESRGPSPAAVTIRGRTWQVELATTPQERYQGLSGRLYLPEDRGMLFAHPRQEVLEYCMRGCHIPLDIAFIDSSGHVVAMHTMAVEDDLVGRTVYGSGAAARYALELAAGSLERAGVRIGDKALFSGHIPSGS